VNTAGNDTACRPRDSSSALCTCPAYQIPPRTDHICEYPIIKHT